MGNVPGVMLYFDSRKPLAKLTAEQKGQLLDAVFDYAEYGVEPELDDITDVCFEFMRSKIDRDIMKYRDTVVKRRYAAYCREAEKRGEDVLPFGEWCVINNERYGNS